MCGRIDAAPWPLGRGRDREIEKGRGCRGLVGVIAMACMAANAYVATRFGADARACVARRVLRAMALRVELCAIAVDAAMISLRGWGRDLRMLCGDWWVFEIRKAAVKLPLNKETYSFSLPEGILRGRC